MGTPFRVLLIDDDPDLRKLTKLTLEFLAGWEVVTAADGAEGLEAARRLKPDAVLLDVMMPGMDGYQVCHRLRHEPGLAGVPVVLLTARKELDDAKVRAAGAAGVLLKPFDPDSLATRIKELIG